MGMRIGHNIVAGSGPQDAKIIIIGESPGEDEDNRRVPFVGPSGQEIRKTLIGLGIPAESVYYDNAVPRMHLPFPSGLKGLDLLREYETHLATARCWINPSPRIIILAGTWALRRVLHHKISTIGPKNLSILKWAGSVIPWTEEDYEASLRNPDLKGIPIPPGSLIFPIMHPAGHLRDPSRTMRPTFMRFMYRALSIAKSPASVWHTQIQSPPEIRRGLSDLTPNASRYFIDYEFSPDTHMPYLLGVTTDSRSPVWQTRDVAEMSEFYANLLRTGAAFTAHHVSADLRASFACYGERKFPKNFDDSLLLHAVLQPDLDHSLSFVTRYCRVGIQEWKWMSQYPYMVEEYNALDVHHLAADWDILCEEARTAPANVWRPYQEEFIVNVPRIMSMEEIGMRVDEKARLKLKTKLGIEIMTKNAELDGLVADSLRNREVNLAHEIAHISADIESTKHRIRRTAQEVTGRFDISFKTTPRDESLASAYKQIQSSLGVDLPVAKKLLDKKFKLLRAIRSEGFRAGNDNDLRWYLTEVVKVKSRKRTKSGLLQVSIDALEPYKDDPVVANVWTVKHNQKLLSTFLSVRTDNAGYAHPPIKLHGTASGRPASGREKKGELDKVGASEAGAFNAFNLPKNIREIYIPDPGDVFIQADIKDLEGRLTALEAGDEVICELFAKGLDTHSWFAAKIFNIPLDEEGVWKKKVKEEYLHEGANLVSPRYRTKRVRHGKNFGMGIRKLSQVLKIPFKEAERIFVMIDELAHGSKRWRDEIIKDVFGDLLRIDRMGRKHWKTRPKRFLTTFFGRLRYFPGLEDSVKKEAISLKPQSGGASIWYRCVDRLCNPCDSSLRIGYGRLVIGTYDSFLVSCPKDKVEECAAWMKEVLEAPFTELEQLPGGKLMPVSFPVDIEIGENYGFVLESDDIREPDPEEYEEDNFFDEDFSLEISA